MIMGEWETIERNISNLQGKGENTGMEATSSGTERRVRMRTTNIGEMVFFSAIKKKRKSRRLTLIDCL